MLVADPSAGFWGLAHCRHRPLRSRSRERSIVGAHAAEDERQKSVHALLPDRARRYLGLTCPVACDEDLISASLAAEVVRGAVRGVGQARAGPRRGSRTGFRCPSI